LALFYNVLNDDDGGRNLASARNNGNEVVSGQRCRHLSVDTAGNILGHLVRHAPRPGQSTTSMSLGVTSTDAGSTFPQLPGYGYVVHANAGAFTDAIGQTDFFLGDAIGLTSADGMAFAVWTDTRNNNPAAIRRATRTSSSPATRCWRRRRPGNVGLNRTTPAVRHRFLGSVSVRRVIPRLVAKRGTTTGSV